MAEKPRWWKNFIHWLKRIFRIASIVDETWDDEIDRKEKPRYKNHV